MNRINQLFANNPTKLLSIYFCAGAPRLEGTANVIRTLAKNGISMIEVGIPFSDPMADGPVIQDAATKALRNGMTLNTLFDQLKDIRQDVKIPLILMGYLNPVIHYGFEKFCQKCVEVGIDGMILPDLPFKDYLEDFKPIADKYDLRIIMLITPETSDERIRFIDQNTDGFIYMVSSAAITGAQKEFNAAKQAYFNHVQSMHLQHPTMIGFGISNKQTLESAYDNANGAIIGSKFVQLLDEAQGDAQVAISKLFEALQQ
ncbi:MAG: tryptophan synthase subunit alpha [Bacteroidales bacterium]|nr:tryptophan synthase subunit alpha [Bacteroidales bacterium]